MLAQLIPADGGPAVTLNSAITVIGRSEKLCDLVIRHSSVSKMHCILVKTDGLIYMRDLGSTNGTRVNGQRVVRGMLLPGDRVTISGHTYKVHLGPDIPGAVAAAANATEVIPVIPEDGGLPPSGNGDLQFRKHAPVSPSSAKTLTGKQTENTPEKRKPRSLKDSDLLPAD